MRCQRVCLDASLGARMHCARHCFLFCFRWTSVGLCGAVALECGWARRRRCTLLCRRSGPSQSPLSRHHQQLDLRIHRWRVHLASALEAGRLPTTWSSITSWWTPRDPAVVYVAAWALDASRRRLLDEPRRRPDLERSRTGLHGQSIRASCRRRRIPQCFLPEPWKASSAARTAALRGPRSARRAAARFTRLSRWRSIRAIPDIVYAGTWHLPWKTTDGGKTWHNIKQGVIDDSDVFSIIIDPDKPQHRLCQRVQRNLQERERGRAVPQDSGDSLDRAKDARAAAGSRRIATWSTPEPPRDSTRPIRRGQDLQAHDRTGCDCE